ncbi:MAG TPA: M23 family metallopeptidase [Longimicrobiales bacterium]|nr:M23 family metallopeptidase [Longimicrobiales bacterium]
MASTMRGPTRAAGLALAAAVLLALPVAAVAQIPRVDVRWEPDIPVQGRLFRVIVNADRPESLERLGAELAGEPLHFHERSPGEYEALAAAPIDESGELRMPVFASWNDGATDALTMAVPIATGEYRLERLTVGPRYGSPPDSALQERMRREAARARRVSEASHETPRLWGRIVHPRPTRVTSGFGHGREFNGQVTSRHMGTDFAGGVGEPVRAAARGVVALVDEFHLGGNVVYIDHGAGLVTAYLHLSEQLVAEGDTVQAGDLIGRVGATGRVTGPHLHWIVRYGNVTVDPLSLLDVATPAERTEQE